MKVTEVTFKRNYAISPLTMEHMHLQVTVAVEEGESTSKALRYAQEQVESFYKDACRQSSPSEYEPKNSQTNFNNDHLYFKMVNDLPSISLVDQIYGCTDLKVLESYRLIAKADTETQAAYDNTLNNIKNGRKI